MLDRPDTTAKSNLPDNITLIRLPETASAHDGACRSDVEAVASGWGSADGTFVKAKREVPVGWSHYVVPNRPVYDRALARRGDLTVWISPDVSVGPLLSLSDPEQNSATLSSTEPDDLKRLHLVSRQMAQNGKLKKETKNAQSQYPGEPPR